MAPEKSTFVSFTFVGEVAFLSLVTVLEEVLIAAALEYDRRLQFLAVFRLNTDFMSRPVPRAMRERLVRGGQDPRNTAVVARCFPVSITPSEHTSLVAAQHIKTDNV